VVVNAISVPLTLGLLFALAPDALSEANSSTDVSVSAPAAIL